MFTIVSILTFIFLQHNLVLVLVSLAFAPQEILIA